MKKNRFPTQVQNPDSTPGINPESPERFARIYRMSKPRDIKRSEIEINSYLAQYEIDRMTRVDGYVMLISFKLRTLNNQ